MIMSKPIVDIIIPNYNKGPFLDECINSVINQSYEYWSLFIIDDCSTDNSSQILDKYKNRKNFKIIKLNKNKGPSFCRNLGMRVSKSDYMAFLDSDDWWSPKKLEKSCKPRALRDSSGILKAIFGINRPERPPIYSNRSESLQILLYDQIIP